MGGGTGHHSQQFLNVAFRFIMLKKNVDVPTTETCLQCSETGTNCEHQEQVFFSFCNEICTVNSACVMDI